MVMKIQIAANHVVPFGIYRSGYGHIDIVYSNGSNSIEYSVLNSTAPLGGGFMAYSALPQNHPNTDHDVADSGEYRIVDLDIGLRSPSDVDFILRQVHQQFIDKGSLITYNFPEGDVEETFGLAPIVPIAL